MNVVYTSVKLIKLYPFNMCSLFYINYTSRNLFLKRQPTGKRVNEITSYPNQFSGSASLVGPKDTLLTGI